MMHWRKIEAASAPVAVSLSGEITENSDFTALIAEFLPHRQLAIDLSDVHRINSCGVREWIRFVTEIGKDGKHVILERCSVEFVNQLNMIANFRGRAEVRSAFAPYYCATCSVERLRFLDLSDGRAPTLDEPHPCPDCGNAMSFDDVPDAYLSFLKAR